MKDFNLMYNELNELLEFCKTKGAKEETIKEVAKDVEAFGKALEFANSRKLLLDTTKEDDIKEFIISSIQKSEDAMNLVYGKYEQFIKLMNEEKANAKEDNAEETKEDTTSEYTYGMPSTDQKIEEGLMRVEDDEEEEEEVKSTTTNNSKKAMAAIAILAVLGLATSGGLYAVSTSMAMKKQSDSNKNDNDSSLEETNQNDMIVRVLKDENGNIVGYYNVEDNMFIPVSESQSDNTTSIEEEEIVITDELISETANKAAKEINTNLEGYSMSEETMEEMIRWINGLNVSEATEEEEMRIVREFLAVLGNDKDAKETFDFSQLFFKTNARKAAKSVYEIRKEVIRTLNTPEEEDTADLMAEFMAKFMNGLRDNENDKLKNIMSFHRLENAGSQLFLTLANNYNYATNAATHNGGYKDKDGNEYYLRQMMESLNTDCVYTYEKKDNVGAPGERVSRETVDLLTSLIYQTLNEAKEMSDVNTLSLK